MIVGGARFGGTRPRRIIALGLAVVASSFLLAACSTGNSSGKTLPIPNRPPKTVPPTTRKMRVDLKVSGYHNLAINGVVGECKFAPAGLPAAYVLTDPKLGVGGQIAVYGPTPVAGKGTIPPNVKTMILGSGLLSTNTGQGVGIRPDLQSVSLNAKISGPGVGPGGGIVGFVSDQITGTLRCI